MTAAKSTRRPRRRLAGAVQITRSIAQWFAGERRVSYQAYGWPHRFALPDYWEGRKSEHPNAVPPEGLHHLLQLPRPGTFIAGVANAARERLGLPLTGTSLEEE